MSYFMAKASSYLNLDNIVKLKSLFRTTSPLLVFDSPFIEEE